MRTRRRIPQVPGRFVAAMLVPDVQLLVVAAETTAPHYVRAGTGELSRGLRDAALLRGAADKAVLPQRFRRCLSGVSK